MKTKPAFTLAEMLVVIIVSGILTMLLTDSMDLVNRYVRRVSDNWQEGNGLLNGYRNLDALLQRCDSAREENGRLCFYRQDAEPAMLERTDSLLIYTQDERRDTLFRSLATLRPVFRQGEPELIDSLCLTVVYRRRKVALAFSINDRETILRLKREKLR